MGKDMFRSGLAHYMAKHKYGNTRTRDLWNAWQHVSGIDVAAHLDSWTSKMGHPYLRVVKEVCDGKSIEITFEQNPFLADGSAGDAEALWHIPLLFVTSTSETSSAVIMDQRVQTFRVPLTHGDGDWIKINAGQKALVRVAHSAEMLRRLIPVIRAKGISSVDRASLLLDTFALAKAGKAPVEDIVRVLRAFEDEDDPTVWSAIAGVLGSLDTMMEEVGGAPLAAFRVAGTRIVKSAPAKVGWDTREGDGHLEKLLRTTVMGLLDQFCSDDADVVAECRRRFDAHWDDASALPAEYKVRQCHCTVSPFPLSSPFLFLLLLSFSFNFSVTIAIFIIVIIIMTMYDMRCRIDSDGGVSHRTQEWWRD